MKISSKVCIAVFLISALFTNACSDFLDLEEDPDVPGAAQMKESVIFPAVCAQWLACLANTTATTLYWHCQLSVNTSNPVGQQYGLMYSTITEPYWSAYSNILRHARDLGRIAAINGNTHYQGIAKLLEAYGWATVTDFFGEVPYHEAFRFPAIYHPKYDEQAVVYFAIEELIEHSIVLLQDSTPQTIVGRDDLIYGGRIDRWLKLAYSLKARYAMRLSYAPDRSTTVQVDTVLAALENGMKSNNDNAALLHYAGSGARGWVYDTQLPLIHGYVATNHMIQMLTQTNDPRLPVYYTKDYRGGYSGLRIGDLYAENQLPSFVSRGIYVYPDMPTVFMTYSECKFLEAEAYVFKGDFDSAKMAFEEGIRADMALLQADIPPELIDAYLEQFDLGEDVETAQEMIISQKYLANFFETSEIHFDKLRTGYPIYNYGANFNISGTIAIPRKLPFPQSEVDMNYNTPDISGNPQTERVWWDNKTLRPDMY